MAGGVAVFDYNGDGRPDIFFTNGADIATLKKSSPKYSNRLFRNNGDGTFTDVTEQAGLKGTGFDVGVAIGDYDNDGHPDIFVAGVHGNTLYHNNGDGTFTDVTKKAGLDKWNDPEYGPLWSVAAVWVDVNNDGLLDLFVVNYLQWTYSNIPKCVIEGVAEYCHPRYYKGLPNQLFLNQGDGTFKDVSKEWGIRDHVGKGMGVGMADYDLDGKPDLFVTNDAEYAFLFHNLGNKFEEVAFQTNVALAEDAAFISGMGTDFRDVNNDGYPDIVYVALKSQTFPLYLNTGKGDFTEATAPSGMRALSIGMSGFGPALLRLRQRWLERSLRHARTSHFSLASRATSLPNPTSYSAISARAANGSHSLQKQASPTPPLHVIAAAHLATSTATAASTSSPPASISDAELWMNRSPNVGHWLDIALRGVKSNRDGIGARIKVVTAAGTQYNHQTSSVCYASSSLGPVHFGLGAETKVTHDRDPLAQRHRPDTREHLRRSDPQGHRASRI